MLLCVGFLLISGNASADAYDHKMTVSPSTQSGDPEEQLQYTITIENTGDNDDTYDMSSRLTPLFLQVILHLSYPLLFL